MMAPSTKRPLSWRTVGKGDAVGVPCEGGYITSSAQEDGVVFQVEGQDGVFVPMSKLQDVIGALEATERLRTRKAGKR